MGTSGPNRQRLNHDADGTYKFVLSVGFGLLGLAGSFFSIKFSYGNVNINIIWSLIFPVLVALAWGRRYGLISIFPGLTVLYPFVVGSYNGWACFVPAFVLLFWILLIGDGSDRRFRKKKFFTNIYFIQLVYTAIRVALYFTVFPLLYGLNPPFWNPAANTSIEYGTIAVFAVKSAIIDLLLLSVADMLLLLPVVRKIFGLDCPKYMRFNSMIVVCMLVVIMFFTMLIMTSNHFLVERDYSFSWLAQPAESELIDFFWAAALGLIFGGIFARLMSERLETRESLEASEKQYRAIFNNLNDIYIETDAEGIIQIIAPSVTKILGYRSQDLTGTNITALYVDPDTKMRIIADLHQTKSIRNVLVQLKDINSDKHDMLFNMELTEAENGRTLIASVARDVTQYIKTKEKLKEVEKKYGLLFDKMTNGIIIIEPVYNEFGTLIDYLIVDANSEFETKTGRKKSEVAGKTFSEIYGFPSQFLQKFEKVFKDGVPQRFVAHDPELENEFDIVNAFMLSDVQAALLFDNITDQILLENELKRVGANLTAIIESTDDLIWSVDRNFAIVQYNTALKRYVKENDGTDVQPGMRMNQLMDEKSAVYWSGLYDRAVKEGKYRIDIPTKNGDRFYSVSFFPMYKDDEINEISVFCREITESKKMEHEIMQLNFELETRVKERTSALQTALQELESFTYTVSHDLKAPLKLIETYSRILIEDHLQGREDEISESTKSIHQISRDMIDFISKLLLYSAASRIELYEEEINLNEMFKAAFDEIVRFIPSREIELVIGGEIPVTMADKVLMKQAVMNILSNAVKFTRKRGHAIIRVDCETGDNELTLCISDNGVGFDNESADKLFTIFHRLYPQSEYEGTGIGLATVRKIIQRHGGVIWIEGEADKGASVYITLPN